MNIVPWPALVRKILYHYLSFHHPFLPSFLFFSLSHLSKPHIKPTHNLLQHIPLYGTPPSFSLPVYNPSYLLHEAFLMAPVPYSPFPLSKVLLLYSFSTLLLSKWVLFCSSPCPIHVNVFSFLVCSLLNEGVISCVSFQHPQLYATPPTKQDAITKHTGKYLANTYFSN